MHLALEQALSMDDFEPWTATCTIQFYSGEQLDGYDCKGRLELNWPGVSLAEFTVVKKG
jgi:hypothetical protein